MSQKKNDSLVIEGGMTVQTALEMKNRILEYVKRKRTWNIDLSGVEGIDAAGLQLLLSLRNYANQKHARLVFTGDLQDELIASLSLFGSDELLTYHQEDADE